MKKVSIVVALAALLGGCSGGASAAPLATPTPTACSQLIPAPPPLIYPESGAAAVPDGINALVVGYASNYAIGISPGANGPLLALPGAPVPSPIPSPAATPVAGAAPVAYGLPVLAAHTTYYVMGLYAAPPCGAGIGPEAQLEIGTFTTQ